MTGRNESEWLLGEVKTPQRGDRERWEAADDDKTSRLMKAPLFGSVGNTTKEKPCEWSASEKVPKQALYKKGTFWGAPWKIRDTAWGLEMREELDLQWRYKFQIGKSAVEGVPEKIWSESETELNSVGRCMNLISHIFYKNELAPWHHCFCSIFDSQIFSAIETEWGKCYNFSKYCWYSISHFPCMNLITHKSRWRLFWNVLQKDQKESVNFRLMLY